MQQSLRLTKILVVISIIMGIISHFTIKQGWGEIYPFFDWKLFSQPRANEDEFIIYRIGYFDHATNEFITIKNNGALVDRDDYSYILDEFVQQFEESKDAVLFKKRLETWGKYLTPEANCFRLIGVYYNPKTYNNANSYHKKVTIIESCQ